MTLCHRALPERALLTPELGHGPTMGAGRAHEHQKGCDSAGRRVSKWQFYEKKSSQYQDASYTSKPAPPPTPSPSLGTDGHGRMAGLKPERRGEGLGLLPGEVVSAGPALGHAGTQLVKAPTLHCASRKHRWVGLVTSSMSGGAERAKKRERAETEEAAEGSGLPTRDPRDGWQLARGGGAGQQTRAARASSAADPCEQLQVPRPSRGARVTDHRMAF